MTYPSTGIGYAYVRYSSGWEDRLRLIGTGKICLKITGDTTDSLLIFQAICSEANKPSCPPLDWADELQGHSRKRKKEEVKGKKVCCAFFHARIGINKWLRRFFQRFNWTKMKVDEILDGLRADDFYIYRSKLMPHGTQILLGAGPTISVYENGTVLVQGNFFNERVRQESVPLLKRVLPPGTKWMVGVR